MRTLALVLILALAAPAAVAAPVDDALRAGEWHRAAQLGASASDVVRALQATGRFADVKAAEAVVVIGPDNAVSVVALAPLPPLGPADAARTDVHTTNLSGTGFGFGAQRGSITLYPAFAQGTFAPSGPAAWRGARP